jgi:hypothetical protein
MWWTGNRAISLKVSQKEKYISGKRTAEDRKCFILDIRSG